MKKPEGQDRRNHRISVVEGFCYPFLGRSFSDFSYDSILGPGAVIILY